MYDMTAEECANWYKNKNKNPRSGGFIGSQSNEYKYFEEDCARVIGRKQVFHKCKTDRILTRLECSELYKNKLTDKKGKVITRANPEFLRYACFCSEMYDLKIPKLNIAKYIAKKTGAGVAFLMKHLKSTLISMMYLVGNLHKMGKSLSVKECEKWRKSGKDPRTGKMMKIRDQKFLTYAKHCQSIISRHPKSSTVSPQTAAERNKKFY